MAVTISVYNHTTARFADGTNDVTNTYKVKLLTVATFDATHASLAATGGTEAATGTGYTAGGQSLSGVAVTTVTTNDAKFDANDLAWSASGGPITASYGILYNDSHVDDLPVAFIDFDGSQSAGAGTQFIIVWNASGIFTWTVT